MSHLFKNARHTAVKAPYGSSSRRFLLVVLAIVSVVPIALYALDGSLPPGSNFNLTYWELDLPIGSGSPTIEPSSKLQQGFTDAYFFTNSSDGAMVMKDPGTNCTKFSKSGYCRTEFHEVDPSNGQETSWSPSGTNKLNATLKVTTVGDGIVISQVFLDDSEQKPLGELEYKSNGDIYLNVENSIDGGDGETHNYVGHADVGDSFSYELSYTNNNLSTTFNNGPRQYWSVPGYASGIHAFFKAGNYGQSSDATDVHFTELKITH